MNKYLKDFRVFSVSYQDKIVVWTGALTALRGARDMEIIFNFTSSANGGLQSRRL